MSDKDYTNVLLEDINSKFDRIVEAVGQVREDVHSSAKQIDLEDVQSDVKIIRAAVTDLSSQVNQQDQRLSDLEASA